jgi:hypothetical protein
MGDIADSVRKLVDVNPGDSASRVASSARINAIQTMLKQMAQGDHIVTGPGMRKRTGTGWHTLTANARIRRGGAAAHLDPFTVTRSSDSDGDAAFGVVPGNAGLKMATMAEPINDPWGTSLKPDPILGLKAPIHDVDTGDAYSIYLRVFLITPLASDGKSTYRLAVDKCEVVTDNEGSVEADLDLDPFENHVKWDDDMAKDKGKFYVKLADIQGDFDPTSGKVIIKTLTQFWVNDIQTIVVAGDDAILFD